MSEPLNSVGAITMFVADHHRAKSFYTTAPWPGSQPLWVCWKYLKMLGNVPAFAGVPMPGKFA